MQSDSKHYSAMMVTTSGWSDGRAKPRSAGRFSVVAVAVAVAAPALVAGVAVVGKLDVLGVVAVTVEGGVRGVDHVLVPAQVGRVARMGTDVITVAHMVMAVVTGVAWVATLH